MRSTWLSSAAFLMLVAVASVILADGPRSIDGLASRADELASPLVETDFTMGLVVGLLVDGETVVHGLGRISSEDDSTPDGKTIYEIGSITKTFTTLLLADAVLRGELELDDEVNDFLPEDVGSLSHDGRGITLLDLATHTSRLPRMPRNFDPADAANPYADYTAENLYEFLANYKLRRTPGSGYGYSNLGMGLLGQILADQANTDYPTLLRQKITEPLALSDTVLELNDDQKDRVAPGHDADLQPVANWDFLAMAGAGAIRSNANDMLRYLQANRGEFEHPLQEAMELSHSTRRNMGVGQGEIAMGWHIQPGTGFLWHNGGTGGYRSFAAFHPEKQLGVVVLTNSTTYTLDALGFKLTQLLAGNPPGPLDLPSAIELSPERLNQYVGKYNLSPGAVFDIELKDGRLMAQLTGQESVRIYPSEEDEFFYRAVDAQISFTRDGEGNIDSLVLHQNGRDMPAKRAADSK